jgi:hypothetical protein
MRRFRIKNVMFLIARRNRVKELRSCPRGSTLAPEWHSAHHLCGREESRLIRPLVIIARYFFKRERGAAGEN